MSTQTGQQLKRISLSLARGSTYATMAGPSFPVLNPATSEEISRVPEATPDEIDQAILNAQKVFESGVWSKRPAIQRSKVLSNLARALEEELPRYAKLEVAQTGRAIREMNAQLGRLPEWLDYFAALLRTNQSYVAPTQGSLLNYVERVPLGVVAQITPFNHPLLIAIKKIAPALAAGNSVIVKPSELAPLTVIEFAELAHRCGIPEGTLTVLNGTGPGVGQRIVANALIKKVDITAGTNAGRAVGSVVGHNLAAFTAELGGKAPIVVFDDADLRSAVNGAAFACFVASGQTCVSGTRLIVQDGIYDEFMKLFLDKVEGIRRGMGDPSDPKCTMGTVISSQHLDRIEASVKRTQGRVVAGGSRLTGKSEVDSFDFSNGSFFPPTVVTEIPLEDELWQEEIFGPVVVVKRFTSEDEGVNLANNCKYGLGAGLWTKDLSRAHRVAGRMEAGLTWVNTHHRNDPSSPWGGMKESGIGRENGVEAYNAYSQSKSVIINTATPEDTQMTDDWFDVSVGRRYG